MIHSVRSELLINVVPQETRVALIENGTLQEVYYERPNLKGYVGNIYNGVVKRVLPGMQSAFVDIGQEKAGFLHITDVLPLREDPEPYDLSVPEADIRQWLREGQELIVQVVRDPLGTKGARLTTHLSLASRYLVYMPDLKHIGVSLRLDDELERDRLQEIMGKALHSDAPQGYIVRTVAQGVSDQDIENDIEFLGKYWASLQEDMASAKEVGLIHQDLPLVQRSLRDMVSGQVEKVRIDEPVAYRELMSFSNAFIPEITDKIECFSGEMPLFEMHGVEREIQNALKRKASLKSGGYIVIDQTEAMTTIDVNTGGFVGSRNLEETTFKTNLEAAQVAAWQIRLRNLGGIIIVDFIDMVDPEHREQVHSSFLKALSRDPAKTQISHISDLGLVQMTRKRLHESLLQQLCHTCPECEGRGRVKTLETICYEIFRELQRESKLYNDADGFVVMTSDAVLEYIVDNESQGLADLECSIKQTIRFQAESNCTQEDYDIILV